ncbi:MAG: hypothetical protein AB1646_01125 [Thermodesulfobacteriota bacterium]
MTDKSITVTLDAETAAVFHAASPEDQRKIELLFRELMDEVGAKAQARGLTPEVLEELLNAAT